MSLRITGNKRLAISPEEVEKRLEKTFPQVILEKVNASTSEPVKPPDSPIRRRKLDPEFAPNARDSARTEARIKKIYADMRKK